MTGLGFDLGDFVVDGSGTGFIDLGSFLSGEVDHMDELP